MHITPLIRIQTTAKLDSVGITSDCVCPGEIDSSPPGGSRGRTRRSMKIEDKDKIKETARIINDPENDKIPDTVLRMRTERIDITPLTCSKSPAIKVSRVQSRQPYKIIFPARFKLKNITSITKRIKAWSFSRQYRMQ